MKINKVFCFFEQSGTFKNQFIKLGVLAEDYDILNEYGETDNILDLFIEINKAYNNKISIFDQISNDDLIIAFFPCIRFENQIMLCFRGQQKQLQRLNCEEKILYDLKLMNELHNMYNMFNYLVLICLKRNIKLIIENPYSKEHFLHRYWCVKPDIIDNDRRERGDYFKKPTQFWFFNCKPENNLIFEMTNNNYKGVIEKVNKKERSLIHSEYANRFIREHIL